MGHCMSVIREEVAAARGDKERGEDERREGEGGAVHLSIPVAIASA